MAKRTASRAAETLNEARWKRTTAPERKSATQAARDARWPKCAACGETKGHDVHDTSRPDGYSHAFENKR